MTCSRRSSRSGKALLWAPLLCVVGMLVGLVLDASPPPPPTRPPSFPDVGATLASLQSIQGNSAARLTGDTPDGSSRSLRARSSGSLPHARPAGELPTDGAPPGSTVLAYGAQLVAGAGTLLTGASPLPRRRGSSNERVVATQLGLCSPRGPPSRSFA